MDLVTKEREPKVNERSFITYKYVYVKDGKWTGAFHGGLVNGTFFDFDEELTAKGNMEYNVTNRGTLVESGFFHSQKENIDGNLYDKSDEKQRVACIVPKNTLYFENQTDIASKNIIVLSKFKYILCVIFKRSLFKDRV